MGGHNGKCTHDDRRRRVNHFHKAEHPACGGVSIICDYCALWRGYRPNPYSLIKTIGMKGAFPIFDRRCLMIYAMFAHRLRVHRDVAYMIMITVMNMHIAEFEAVMPMFEWICVESDVKYELTEYEPIPVMAERGIELMFAGLSSSHVCCRDLSLLFNKPITRRSIIVLNNYVGIESGGYVYLSRYLELVGWVYHVIEA